MHKSVFKAAFEAAAKVESHNYDDDDERWQCQWFEKRNGFRDAIPWVMACQGKTERKKLSAKWKCNTAKHTVTARAPTFTAAFIFPPQIGVKFIPPAKLYFATISTELELVAGRRKARSWGKKSLFAKMMEAK
jgi:hypothetical protein